MYVINEGGLSPFERKCPVAAECYHRGLGFLNIRNGTTIVGYKKIILQSYF